MFMCIHHCHNRLIPMPCCMFTSLIYSHLSTGVFQRCLLLPPPENEIRPLLQHASRKLPLVYIYVCVCMCVATNQMCFTYVFAFKKITMPNTFNAAFFVSSFICFYPTFVMDLYR